MILIQDMMDLNHESLYEIWKNTELSHSKQKALEITLRETLLTQSAQSTLSQNYVTLLKS